MAKTAKNDDRILEYMIVKSLAKKYKVVESDVKILEWFTEAGIAATDNFATDMVAVKGKSEIQGKQESFSFMTKVVPKGEMRNDMVKQVINSHSVMLTQNDT